MLRMKTRENNLELFLFNYLKCLSETNKVCPSAQRARMSTHPVSSQTRRRPRPPDSRRRRRLAAGGASFPADVS